MYCTNDDEQSKKQRKIQCMHYIKETFMVVPVVKI